MAKIKLMNFLPIPFFLFGIIKLFGKSKNTMTLPIENSKEFAKITAVPKIRGCDNENKGCGYYNASRGDHDHHGVDLIAFPGEQIYSPISGSIRRLIVYPNQNDMLGVEITSTDGIYKVKIFYLDTLLKTNEFIIKGEYLGTAQDVASYWNAKGVMTNHVHVEVRKNGKLIDPTNLIT